jgi:diadenosine tetraphosphate (Ap4A) HIT family hydrolase
MASEPISDNECYLIAKQELFQYTNLRDLTMGELSEIIRLAQEIKERSKRMAT